MLIWIIAGFSGSPFEDYEKYKNLLFPSSACKRNFNHYMFQCCLLMAHALPETKHSAIWMGLRKKALRNLWSEALSSENLQLGTKAKCKSSPNVEQKLIVAFFAVAERNKF
jgi:hypothetical protein